MTAQTQRRLTSTEIASFRAQLFAQNSPDALRALVEGMREIAGWYLLCQAGLSSLWRDAFIAAEVARLKGAELVRLIDAERPDFAVTIGGVESLYEATQADQPGRQMSREYRDLIDAYPDGAPPPECDTYEDVSVCTANAPAMLETAARLKAGGDYDPAWGLVIYLNLDGDGSFRTLIESCMEAATAPAHGRFHEVLILWKDTLYAVGSAALSSAEKRSPYACRRGLA